MYTINSIKVAEGIRLKSYRSAFPSGIIFSDERELVYQIGEMQFISVFSYGVICFFNIEEEKMAEYKHLASPLCNNKLKTEIPEEFYVEYGADEIKYTYNSIKIPKFNLFVIRLIMFHVAQSVALTYYFEQTKIVMEEINIYTLLLGTKGKIFLKGKSLRKFLGRTLQIKNQIIGNLYILDASPGTNSDDLEIDMDKTMKEAVSQYFYWKSVFNADIDSGMKYALKMKHRSEMVYEEIKIIREQIEFFSETLHQNMSVRLEWVIIILVAYEVVDLIVGRIIH